MKFAEPGAGKSDFNFTSSSVYEWTGAGFRRLTGIRLVKHNVSAWAWRWTRWWRSRTVTTKVDVERGIITLGHHQRWSWLRWRWE